MLILFLNHDSSGLFPFPFFSCWLPAIRSTCFGFHRCQIQLELPPVLVRQAQVFSQDYGRKCRKSLTDVDGMISDTLYFLLCSRCCTCSRLRLPGSGSTLCTSPASMGWRTCQRWLSCMRPLSCTTYTSATRRITSM